MFGRRRRRRPEISAPRNFVHRVHTGYDPQGMCFTGLPVQWHGLLQETLVPRHRQRSPDPSCIPPWELRALKKIVRGRRAAMDGDVNGLLNDFYKLSIPGSNSLYSECPTRQSCVSDQGPLSNWEHLDQNAHKQRGGLRPPRHSSEPSPHRDSGVYPVASPTRPAGPDCRPDSQSHEKPRGGGREVEACGQRRYEAFPLLSPHQPLSVAPALAGSERNPGRSAPAEPHGEKPSLAFSRSRSDGAWVPNQQHRQGAKGATPPHGGNGPGPTAGHRRGNNHHHHHHHQGVASGASATTAVLGVIARDDARAVVPARYTRRPPPPLPHAADMQPPDSTERESCSSPDDAVRYRHRERESGATQQQQQRRQRPHSLLEPAVGPLRPHERPWSGYALWGPQLPVAPGLSRVRWHESQEFV